MNKNLTNGLIYYLPRIVFFVLAWLGAYLYVIPWIFGIRDVGLTYWAVGCYAATLPAICVFLISEKFLVKKFNKPFWVSHAVPIFFGYPLILASFTVLGTISFIISRGS
jgi:hypothetical protein